MLWPIPSAGGTNCDCTQSWTACQQQVTTYFRLHNSIICMACLSAQCPLPKIRNTGRVCFQTASLNRLSVSFISLTRCLQTSVLKHLVSLCSIWCLISSSSWVGNTGSMKSLPRNMCLLLSTSIWTSSSCSSSCCSSSGCAANAEPPWQAFPQKLLWHNIKLFSTSYIYTHNPLFSPSDIIFKLAVMCPHMRVNAIINFNMLGFFIGVWRF